MNLFLNRTVIAFSKEPRYYRLQHWLEKDIQAVGRKPNGLLTGLAQSERREESGRRVMRMAHTLIHWWDELALRRRKVDEKNSGS